MSISFLEESNEWTLEHTTEKERSLLLELGKETFLSRLGYSILQRMEEQVIVEDEKQILEEIPKEQMGSA